MGVRRVGQPRSGGGEQPQRSGPYGRLLAVGQARKVQQRLEVESVQQKHWIATACFIPRGRVLSDGVPPRNVGGVT